MGNDENTDKLFAMLRLTALNQLQIATHVNDSEISEEEMTDAKDLNCDHWVTLIFVSGSAMQMKFRTHFSIQNSRKLAAKGLSMSPKDVDDELAYDFMREFCNLTAGAIKRCLLELQDRQLEVKIGLPHQFACENIAKINDEAEVYQRSDLWKLYVDGIDVVCAVDVNILDLQLISKIGLAEIPSIVVSSKGAVKFL